MLLLLAARTTLPAAAVPAAVTCALLVLGLDAFRMGGPLGAAAVALVVALWPRATRAVPPLAVLASLAVDYPLLRVIGDPVQRLPLPLPVAVAAVVLPLVTLPFALRQAEHRATRWGVWLAGVGMFALLTERYYAARAPLLAPDDVLLTLGGSALVVAAAIVTTRRWHRAIAGAALGALVLVGILVLSGTPYGTDAAVTIDEAARVAWRGGNPYAEVDLAAALEARGLPRGLLTDLEDGTQERRFVYPAGAFLPYTLVVAGGDVRLGFLAVAVLAYLVVALRAPRVLAPYVGALALANVMVLRQVIAGIEPSWALFLLAALVVGGVPGGVAAGLASASRQTAWAYLPWIALDRWREAELRRWLAAAAAAFALVNAPYALADPARWLAHVTAPLVSPYEPFGIGLVRLVMEGLLPDGTRLAFTAAFVVAALAALWMYARRRAEWRYGVAVLPVAPLFLAWRSLQSYFMFAPLFLMEILAEDRLFTAAE